MATGWPDSGIPDKKALYGEYTRAQKWKDKLFRKGCHKALDIPDDDMQISNHTQGITGRHIVALFGLAMAAALGWRALQPIPQTSSGPVQVLPAASEQPLPVVQEYKVEFWADDGTKLRVSPDG